MIYNSFMKFALKIEIQGFFTLKYFLVKLLLMVYLFT